MNLFSSMLNFSHGYLRLAFWIATIALIFSVKSRASAADLTSMPEPDGSFGERFTTHALGIGPTMDVAVDQDFIYAIGHGKLTVLSNPEAQRPNVIGTLEGLGSTRQIAIHKGFAYITAREEGLFIVDVREPSSPKVVSHYDTAELATAIAVSGSVAAVGNRFAGIELLDISDPTRPIFLSCIRAGEVQSLVFHGAHLYAGAWSEKEVVVMDVSHPNQPKRVNRTPLEGYGDGLDVQGVLLAAAAGHHAPGKGQAKPGDRRFGAGHGIEFFDVTDPSSPQRISGLKFPPFYRLGMDMWGVVLSDGYAFVNDTHNGFFMIDVRDPLNLKPVGWARLPQIKGEFSPAAGIAVSKGRVFIAGAFDDLHFVETSLANAPAPALAGKIEPQSKATLASSESLPAYRVQGSIRSVVPWKDNLLLVAAGSAGWHVVEQLETGFKPVAAYKTKGFARDITFHENRVFVAESLGGVSVWERDEKDGMREISRYSGKGKAIHQVVVADAGRTAFLAVGANQLQGVRISKKGEIQPLMEPVSVTGLFYREPFSALSQDGKTMLAQWHVTGLLSFESSDGQATQGAWTYPHRMGTGDGVAPYREGWVVTTSGGFVELKSGESQSPAELGIRRVEGVKLHGKPSTFGEVLFVADPFLGEVRAVDLSESERPKLVQQIQISGHPGRVKVHQGKALIPAGRDGLLLWEWDKSEKSGEK